MSAYYPANYGNEYSKSARASQAEREGRYPRTIAAKKLGISPKAFDAGCKLAEYHSDEWHHVGKYANCVTYYDTTELTENDKFWEGAASAYKNKTAQDLFLAYLTLKQVEETLAKNRYLIWKRELEPKIWFNKEYIPVWQVGYPANRI